MKPANTSWTSVHSTAFQVAAAASMAAKAAARSRPAGIAVWTWKGTSRVGHAIVASSSNSGRSAAVRYAAAGPGSEKVRAARTSPARTSGVRAPRGAERRFVHSRCNLASRGYGALGGAPRARAVVRFFLGTMAWNLSEARRGSNMRISAIVSAKLRNFGDLQEQSGRSGADDFAWAFLDQVGPREFFGWGPQLGSGRGENRPALEIIPGSVWIAGGDHCGSVGSARRVCGKP